MFIASFFRPMFFTLALTLALAACKSAEERAEEHFQNGVALTESGDIDRAIIEFRNVFQLNGSHQEARHKLAEVLLEHRGNTQGAYGQYLRLVEQYPDDLNARIILSELAFSISNWDELDRHGTKAHELAPNDARVQAIMIARAYRVAVRKNDPSAIRYQGRSAQAMLGPLPTSIMLQNILIDAQLRDGEIQAALQSLDRLLEQEPQRIIYWRQKLNILAQLNEMEKIEELLREMVERFPEDATNKQALLRFYISRDDSDKAEGFLRELAAIADTEEVGPRVDLIKFLLEARSPGAAQIEIEKAITEYENPAQFRALGASIDFSIGNRDAAIAELEDVLEGAQEPSDEMRGIKITLSQFLLTMGDDVGSRALVEEVLAEDATHVEASKMLAAWRIEADQTDRAIAGLRIVLDNAPDDAPAMTLMSQAYARAGQPELARDFMALAAGASNNAPAETVRYARLLIAETRYIPAEDVLLPALRLAPQNVDLLVTLSQLYLAMDDLGRAEQAVKALQRIDTPEAQQAAISLEAQRVKSQSGVEEAMEYLEGVANASNASLTSKILLIRARLGIGDAEGALTMARQELSEDPENETLQVILASVEALNNNLETASILYRSVLEKNSNRSSTWLELVNLKIRQGDPMGARAVLTEALTALPDNANLLWAKANYHERDGEFDEAIAIYENLYAVNSNSLAIANNLAGMLAIYRTDTESLDRAWTIARRFSDTQNPAVQDTYGWILHRRGESADAVPYLKAAAAGLRNDPIVQYHLAEAYLAVGLTDDALMQFKKVSEIAGLADDREQILAARAQIEALENLAAAEADN